MEDGKKRQAREMAWSVLESRTVFKDRWVHLKADDCRMPDGTRIAPFYVNHVPDFVVVVAVTAQDQVVMIRQYRHGLRRVLLELPAGCVDPGEEPLAAARRELEEETGYLADRLEYLCKIAPNASCLSHYAYCYLATDLTQSSGRCLDPSEDIEVELLSMDQVREEMERDGIVQAVHMAALYRAFQQLGKLRF